MTYTRPQILAIAGAAEVAPQTVVRFLSGLTGQERKRQRIQKALKDLGFAPSEVQT